jgi:hypothetical protein
MAKKPTAGKTFVIEAVVMNIEPKIWRRLLVPASMKLHRVHRLLQLAFGWHDYHLFEFQNEAGVIFGQPNDIDRLKIKIASRNSLRTALRGKGAVLFYTYDLDYEWEVALRVEEVVDEPLSAACVDGARAGPPEDCGGTAGYREPLKALVDPNHEGHAFLDKSPDRFKPERFNLRAVDALIREEFE